MEYSRTWFRDTIRLDADFKTRTGLEAAAPLRTTILLAARELTVDGFFELRGRDVVLLADRFNGSPGFIGLSGLPGDPGPNITIVCRELAGANISSAGGTGHEGEPGEPGAEGRAGRPAALPNKPGGVGGRGGRGTSGHQGETGGTGGAITIVYVNDRVPGGVDEVVLQAPGGRGGDGGPGGPGGPGGEGGPGTPDGRQGPEGFPGNRGQRGAIGAAGTVRLTQVTEAEYWQAVLPLADRWADYRLGMGEYFFRAFNPSGLPASEYLALALSEFEAVLQLEPPNIPAATYRNQLLNNQNVLGLARDIDIIPEFEHYERVLTQYGPLVSDLFAAASNLLSGNLTREQIAQTLRREIAHVEGLRLALEAERSAAERGRLAAGIELQTATARIAVAQSRIADRREELERKHIDWGGVLTFTILAVGAAVVTLATGGSGAPMLLSFLPDILILAGPDFGVSPSAQADVLGKARGLKELSAAKTPGQAAPLALSFAKMLADLDEAEGDAEMIALLRELVQLTHAKLLAELRDQQSDLALRAVTLQLAQAVHDVELARAQLSALTEELAFLEQAALGLIRSAQRYMSILAKYAFFAARSLEIYTLDDLSEEIRFDYGYIHPDLEQDHREHILPLAQIIVAYEVSRSRFIDIIHYRNLYDSHFLGGDTVQDKIFFSITDPARLARFRGIQQLPITVDLGDLPPTRFEAKAVYVLLSLAGATANAPAISCLVEHGGRFTAAKRGGDVASMLLEPRLSVVQTAKTPLAFTGVRIGSDPRDLSFWGRGVATSWNVSIEADEMVRRQVDLSGLTAIEVEIGYEAFV